MGGITFSEVAADHLSSARRLDRVGLVFQFPERHFLGKTMLDELTFGWGRADIARHAELSTTYFKGPEETAETAKVPSEEVRRRWHRRRRSGRRAEAVEEGLAEAVACTLTLVP